MRLIVEVLVYFAPGYYMAWISDGNFLVCFLVGLVAGVVSRRMKP